MDSGADRPAVSHAEETGLGRLPCEWRISRLGKCVRFDRGVSWRKSDEATDGIPVIGIPNIKDDYISSEVNYRINKLVPTTKLLRRGDILLVGSSGAVKNVGRQAVVEHLPF